MTLFTIVSCDYDSTFTQVSVIVSISVSNIYDSVVTVTRVYVNVTCSPHLIVDEASNDLHFQQVSVVHS